MRPSIPTLLAATLLAAFHTVVRADEPPLKIGVLTDMTGPYGDASGPGSVHAARMAIADFGGSVLGRAVQVLGADHQNKPDIGTDIARQWFDREGVRMITDLTNSSVALAVQAVAKQRDRIDLVTSTATTALTNGECSPSGVHWTYDAYALSAGTAGAMVAEGGKSWYFITADYAFGTNLQATAKQIVENNGGKVLGSSLAPLNTTDFAAQLIAAQASGADVVGLANAGADTANSVKQAFEFGLTKKQKLAAFLPFITDIKAIGIDHAQGLTLTTAFYWDRNDETRAWSARFEATQKAKPTMIHAGTYSAVLHYLKAVQKAGTVETGPVMQAMRDTPVNDPVFRNGRIRADGVMEHDMYLVRVKAPTESEGPWALYTVLRNIPGDKAFQPLAESTCPLLKKAS